MLRILCIFALTSASLYAGTSNSLLDVSPDGTRLLVANTDQGTVTAVDLKSGTVLCEIPVGDSPEGVAWIGADEGVATVYGDDALVFFNIKSKSVKHVLKVPDEPYGVVTNKDYSKAYLSHDYPGSVSEIDLKSRQLVRTIPAGANCRGIAIAHDEKKIYVSEFLSSKLVGVNLAAGRATETWEGFEQDNIARSVTLHPTRDKAYLPHSRSRVDVFSARGSIFPQLTYCDLWSKDGKRRRTTGLDSYNGVTVTATPWETALSPDGKKLYIIYAGTNDANVSTVFDDDYRESESIGRVIRVGRHPRAVRTFGDKVYIYNTLDHEVGAYDPYLKPISKITVTGVAHSKEWERGKELFNTARRPMASDGWVSCASCHQDGLTDGRVWQNPEGNRRTPHLFGVAHTHPLHWSADRDESQDFEYTIRGKLMKGPGLFDGKMTGKELEMHTAGLSKDLDAMALYTNSFPVRPSPHTPDASSERGKALFFDAKTNCASCHSGPWYSDSTLQKPFKLHDVGTGRDARETMGTKYDTPTLVGVYRSGPYLHDGSAKTLKDVLTTCNKDDKHGVTSHLNAAQIDDLVAFLKTLPVDVPLRTANTVKDYAELKFPKATR